MGDRIGRLFGRSETVDEMERRHAGKPIIMSRRAIAIFIIALAIGAAGTLLIGQRVKTDAMASWTRQAELDAAVATESAQAWLAQAETILKGLAVAFQQPGVMTAPAFARLVDDASEWNSEFALDSVATVRRVSREDRSAIEMVMGGAILSAGGQPTPAPDAFEHFVVEYSSSQGALLKRRRDLLTDKTAGDLIKTAHSLAGQVVMGPVRKAADGRLLSLVGLGLTESTGDQAGVDVIVAEVDISALINHLTASQLPAGIRLRLSERETESSETTSVRPIFGPLQPAPDVVHTTTLRLTKGLARWNYHWDILPDYLGGPPTGRSVTLQVGGLLLAILSITAAGFLIHQNVTIRKKVREQTVELREIAEEANFANRAKTEFLANMSHELRTPLNAVIGYSEMLCQEMFGPLGHRRYREYATDINSSGSHLMEVIGDILDVSRIEAGKMELTEAAFAPSDAVEACVRIVSERAASGGVQLQALTTEGLADLYGDEVRIKQIVLNLLSNAIKFTPEGGRVDVGFQIDDGGLVLSVADTGIGIVEDEIPNLTAPFQQLGNDHTRAEPGTGLGLYLCKSLAELHGGELIVESTLGVGTRVVVVFPPERTVT